MALKHVKQYYDQIVSQYTEMLDDLREFEQLTVDGMFSPEQLEQIKHSIEPLKDNYERWTYMMFLLNQPTRKQKKPKYDRLVQQMERKKKLNREANSVENTVKENSQILHSFCDNFLNICDNSLSDSQQWD